MAHLHCPSGAPLCYAVCHTPCCSYSLRSGSYLCPSCHFIHSVLRYASFHHVRSCNIATRHGTLSCTQGKAQVMHMLFRKPTLQILTGFHFASLRPSFISVAFSPPAAYNLACLAACHSCGFVMVFVLNTSP